jgi:putative transposase
MSMNDINSLSHSKCRCKYHIVFAPKYRRQAIYGKIKVDIGKILRELTERKEAEIIEAECCSDYIHNSTYLLIQTKAQYYWAFFMFEYKF